MQDQRKPPAYPPLALLSLAALLAGCGNSPSSPSLPIPPPTAHPTETLGLTYTRAYHVDCKTGSDSNSGLSENTAWKTLSKANAAPLQPGEALLFKRGCTWDGQLKANWNGTDASPILIGAYGSGNLPRIRTTGSQQLAVDIRGTRQILEFLEPVVGNRPSPNRNAVRCPRQSVGWRVAFAFHGNHNTVRHSTATRFTAAIHFTSGSTGNRALRNTLKDNDIMSRNDADGGNNDSGAWGVLLNGSGNEVAYNTFGGNIACSEDYGIEGASVEIYAASDNAVHHNRSINDSTFSELGGLSERNVFAFNVFAPLDEASQKAAEFLVIRGNQGTRAHNNTAYKVQVGVACFDGCDSSVLDFRNNIVIGASDARKNEFFSDLTALESHNVFGRIGGSPSYSSGTSATSTPGSGSRLLTAEQTSALLQDPDLQDFHLKTDSLAIDAGTRDALLYFTDLDGATVPNGTNPDAGAYER